METKRYCKPLSTEWETAAKNIATLLVSLERINRRTIESGEIVHECQKFSDRVVDTLRSEGWAISYARKEQSGKVFYHITPPKEKS
jgi:hypothetical protein